MANKQSPPVRHSDAGPAQSPSPSGFQPCSQTIASFNPTASLPIPCPPPRPSRHPHPPQHSPPIYNDLARLSNNNTQETNTGFAEWWTKFPPAQLSIKKPPEPTVKEPQTPVPNPPTSPTLSTFDPRTPHRQPGKPFPPSFLERQVSIYSAQTAKFTGELELLSEDLRAVHDTITALRQKLGETERALTKTNTTPLPKYQSHPSFPAEYRRGQKQRMAETGRYLEQKIARIQSQVDRLLRLRREIKGGISQLIARYLKQDSGGSAVKIDGDVERKKRKIEEMNVSSQSRWRSSPYMERYLEEQEEDEIEGLLRDEMKFWGWRGEEEEGRKLPGGGLVRRIAPWWGEFKKEKVWEGKGKGRGGEWEMGEFMGKLERLRKRVEVDGWLVRETRGARERKGELEKLERAVEVAKGRVRWEEEMGGGSFRRGRLSRGL